MITRVMTWKSFPHYWPFVRKIHRRPVDSPQKGPVMQDFEVCFVVRRNNVFENSSVIGNFRHHDSFVTSLKLECAVSALSCFVEVRFSSIVSVLFNVASLSLGQSYVNSDKSTKSLTWPQQNRVHILEYTLIVHRNITLMSLFTTETVLVAKCSRNNILKFHMHFLIKIGISRYKQVSVKHNSGFSYNLRCSVIL